MTKYFKLFALGLGLSVGAGISPTLIANAAIDDQIVKENGDAKEVKGATANCYAQCAIDALKPNGENAEIWTGTKADMIKTCVQRDSGTSSGFTAYAHGYKTYHPSNLPTQDGPVQVVGTVVAGGD